MVALLTIGVKIMHMELGNMVIQLAEGKRLAFRGARDVHLECTEGRIWLTVEGQSDDFLLAKGERLRIASNGHALIQGLPSGSVQLLSKATRSIRPGSRFAWPSDLFAVHMVA
jgi:hypothetical protein